MPFKLTNTPAIMQSLVNDILRKYFNKFYIIYLNNILIFLGNKKKYKRHIITVLKTLKKTRLQIKPKKCVFHVNKIKYLKFIITSQGLRIDPIKI